MILQKQIQTSKATILVIGNLPGSAKILRSDIGVLTVELQNENLDTSDYAIPVGEWKPLGFLKDIKEDVAKFIISIYDFPMQYTNYKGAFPFSFEKATESLHSLIEANCKLKNEYGDYDQALKYFETDKWNKEQSQVFNNPFLLKKI